MKKYRCPNCKEVFMGTQEICPKCGVKLRYADQQKDKPVVEEATTVSNFSFNDPDVVKHEVEERQFFCLLRSTAG